MEQAIKKKKRKVFRSKQSLIFYVGLMIIPVVQFLIMYVAVNINTFVLAFTPSGKGEAIQPWTYNFSYWFTEVGGSTTQLVSAIKVSVKSYLIMLLAIPTGLFFAYYIFKKLPGAMFFRLMLFLPSMISAIVLVQIYENFLQYGAGDFLNKIGITTVLDVPYRYPKVIFYTFITSFGTTVLLYSNKMSSISPELIDACHLDGASQWQEFWHVVLPHTFPTLSVFIVTGVAGLFINQINGFSFFGYNQNMPQDSTTLGFLLFRKVKAIQSLGNNEALPPYAALGLMMTVIAVPLTFLVRWLLNKFGPSED